MEAVYGGQEGVQGLIEMSRAAEAAGGQIIPASGPEGATGVLMPIGGYYYEEDRGAIPAYDNQWNNAGWEGWLTYHPADNADRLTQPLAIVHSESAAIPQGVRTFLDGFTGEATLQMLADVTQFDFYDNPRRRDPCRRHRGRAFRRRFRPGQLIQPRDGKDMAVSSPS